MPNNWSIFPGTLVNVCSPFRNSISPTPTGTCVDGIQVRRMYVACKNRSGFPGTMPVGSDSKHEDVSVQAILEGLGLIASPGEESPKSASFNTTHNIWPVPEASESTSPSQSTDDTLPRLCPGECTHLPTAPMQDSARRTRPTDHYGSRRSPGGVSRGDGFCCRPTTSTIR
jgi:hypothetical protein